MDIVLVDDSVPFDGTTPLNEPLGGAEKAVIGLAEALASRGQGVTVLNRTPLARDIKGVAWRPLEGERPARADLLVAFRHTELLDAVPEAARTLLWLTGAAGYLKEPAHAHVLARHPAAKFVFSGATHRGSWDGDPERAMVVSPGVPRAYLQAQPNTPYHPPRALVTTHPRMDLDWLLDLWTDRIQPRAPHAELLVFSAAFAAGRPSEDLARVYVKARDAGPFGVRLLRPLADPDMANVFRTARVHLYPGHAKEVYAASLAESQAAGVPAVARKLGAAPERVKDGRSGYLVPDDEAFVNCAVLLLNDDSVFWARSRDGRSMQRVRTWDAAAADVEALAA